MWYPVCFLGKKFTKKVMATEAQEVEGIDLHEPEETNDIQDLQSEALQLKRKRDENVDDTPKDKDKESEPYIKEQALAKINYLFDKYTDKCKKYFGDDYKSIKDTVHEYTGGELKKMCKKMIKEFTSYHPKDMIVSSIPAVAAIIEKKSQEYEEIKMKGFVGRMADKKFLETVDLCCLDYFDFVGADPLQTIFQSVASAVVFSIAEGKNIEAAIATESLTQIPRNLFG